MHKTFTEDQIAALKYVICASSEQSELLKRVLLFLIDESLYLTREVCVTLLEDRDGYAADQIRDAAHGLSRLQSMSYAGSLHLVEIMRAMGAGYLFSVHYGDYDPSWHENPFSEAGQFAGSSPELVLGGPELTMPNMPLRFSFWLARECYSECATQVAATREQLESIDFREILGYPFVRR